ncbi:MAG: retropepsin-like aspartic protease [Syntrophorhabdales bacterium]
MKWLFVLFFVALCLPTLAAGDDGPPNISDILTKQGFVAVQLIRGTNGRFQAVIRVDRYDDVRVLVDTGSDSTIFDISWLSSRKYRLQEIMRPLQTLGGPHEAKTATVDNIRIGKVNTGPMIIGGASLEFVNKGAKERGGYGVIEGILGMDVLTRHSAIIDVKKSTLYLKSQEHEGDASPAE